MKKVIFILFLLFNFQSYIFSINKFLFEKSINQFISGNQETGSFLRSIGYPQFLEKEESNYLFQFLHGGYLFFGTYNNKEEKTSLFTEKDREIFSDKLPKSFLNSVNITLESGARNEYFYYFIETDDEGELLPNCSLRSSRIYKRLKDPKKFREKLCQFFGSIYKVHLQVSKQHFLSFIEYLVRQLNLNDLLYKNIDVFKITNFSSPESHSSSGGAMPIIVLYVNKKIQPRVEIYKRLTQIIDNLNDIVEGFCKEYNVNIDDLHYKDQYGNVKPRYNLHLKNIIYLAGGDADNKNSYIDNYVLNSKFPNNRIYTEDYVFFKHYDFYYTKADKEKRRKKLVLEIEKLQEDLQLLKEY